MTNFELRIYVIPFENADEVIEDTGVHDLSDLDDERFIKIAEEIGTVYSLNKFLSLDIIAPDNDIIRAYFVSVEDSSNTHIRADQYYTVISANKITNLALDNNCKERVLYQG